ncbi:MAG: sensor signal transduction histidine kinase [Geobacteraceae bacterium]|nr:sensor signal transduction histidine kinase [Geobacteraceae bacterium]
MEQEKKERLSPTEVKRRRREGFFIILSIMLIMGLTAAEVRLSQFSPDFPAGNNILIFGLINVIILLIILLVYLVFRNIAKLMLDRKSNPFGARLRGKLVLAFVSLSLIPTLLLFFVSASFINISIKRWFDKQVETSLEESLDVAGAYYKNNEANAIHYGRQISSAISGQTLLDGPDTRQLAGLASQKQKEYNLGVLQIYSPGHEELVRVSDATVPPGEFEVPSFEDIQAALQGRVVAGVHSVGKADFIRGIVPVYSSRNSADIIGAVAVSYYMPYSLADRMQQISSQYEEYRQMKLLKSPVRSGYILTLFLITMVIVFLAIWLGVYLANSLTTPIKELAEATRQVAEGKLDIHIEGEGEDEIGMLVASFNKMTEDLRCNQLTLRKTNDELSRSNQELDQRRRYMEIVLRNVTAGVISVGRTGILTTVNKSAERLLKIDTKTVLGRHFREILRPDQLDIIKGLLRDMVLSKKDTISRQVSIPLKEGALALLVHVTLLKDENGEFMGTVVVFDDLTQLVKAQRVAAWREVARRIAHEIKNPLTPIKLCAQRLRKRYLSMFDGEEKVFDECTAMIIKSVDELKTLVDEFSNFARMPAAQPTANNLNDIIRESLALYQEAHRTINFSFRADDSVPLQQLDRDQMKRVLINLLDNAVAALDGEGRIDIESSYNPELQMVTFAVADTGHGIPPEDKPRLFEPYFSRKKSGTGLGLAIVNTIISDHHGFIRVKDNVPKGTKFVVELPAGGARV